MRQLLNFAFFFFVFVSWSLFSSYPTYLGVVVSFCIFLFLFLFESSVSFIFQIDSLSTRETIIAVLFCLFSSFYCFLSYIYIYIYAKLVLFGVGFSFAKTARRWDERCECVRILRVFKRNTSDVRIVFFTTNQFLQVQSCQIKTTHHPIQRILIREREV